MSENNNTRIAKNTMFLYLRMIIQLIVGLYTSRVILHALGITDYGIYNVVGGVVALFSFLNGSMGTATNRYLAYELGRENVDKVKMRHVFSTALIIHICVAAIFLLLCETVGLWYMYHVLVVPPERLSASLWVFQFSIITSIVAIISVPYNATIIAHEKMSAFAYITIIEAFILLFIALIVSVTKHFDRLLLYGILVLISQMFIRLLYTKYCNKHFNEVKGKLFFDKDLFFDMSKFAFWILNGGIAVVGYTQGLNLLLNFFFGPAVNAARGVAVTVQTKIISFCNNFQMAVNPQIIKSYAEGNLEYMHKLICYSSVFSFYLVFLLSFPIIIECEHILGLWLKEVPEYTGIFVRLTLGVGIIDSLRMPLNTSIHATGNISKFQLIEGTTSLAILPIAYVFLKFGCPPVSVFIVQLVLFVIIQMERVLIVCPAIKMKKILYVKVVLVKVVLVVFAASIIPCLFNRYYVTDYEYLKMVLNIIVSISSTLFVVYFIGTDKDLRKKVKEMVLNKIKKNEIPSSSTME